jgi:hypothetical protein
MGNLTDDLLFSIIAPQTATLPRDPPAKLSSGVNFTMWTDSLH